MRRYAKYLTVCIMVLAVVLGFNTMKVSAAQVRTGTLGDNNGVQWSYEEDTKTLTLTGLDGGLYLSDRDKSKTGVIYNICPEVEKIVLKDFAPQWSVNRLFAGLTDLKEVEADNFDTSKVSSMEHMFADCSSLVNIDVSEWNTSNVTKMTNLFSGCSSLTTLDVSEWNTANVTSMSSLFFGCSSLTTLDVSEWDTSNVTVMRSLFSGCGSLTTLDVSKWNTSNVRYMEAIFRCCSSLTTLDVSEWNVSNVTTISQIFQSCSSLTTLDVSKWDTSNVSDMSWVFAGCTSLSTLDVSKWNTEKVKEMAALFQGCENLTALDVSGFDTKNVKRMAMMFENCDKLTSLDLSHFDTSNVTTMAYMFRICRALQSLDLSSFDMSKCETTDEMLLYCCDITKLHAPKLIPEGLTISLPMNYTMPSGRKISVITAEHNGMALSREEIRIVCPGTMYVGETRQLYIKKDDQLLDVSENDNYLWEASSANVRIKIPEPGVAKAVRTGSVLVICKDKESGEELAKTFVKVIELTDPVILTQPADITMSQGNTAVFKVEALANGITYQWQYKPGGSTQWYNSGMTGSNTDSLNVVATTARNDYQYRCVIEDKDGNKVTSNPAKLTVVKAIDITSQPASATVNEGTKVTFKVEAKGNSLTYQWQFKSAGSDYWANSSMAGSKSNSMTVDATSARNGYQYRCVVKDANGNKATSNVAKLTVEKSIDITGQPASATAAEGAKVTFKVEAKGTGLTYQWQFKSAGSNFWADSSMAGSKTNSITVEATSARNGYQYRCVVKDANGSKVTTNAAKLTVNKSIEITSQPASATVGEGAKVTFKVEAKGTGLTYQWQFKNASATYWSDSSMAGSKTNSITVEATSARNGYQYRCVVKDANGSKVTTNAAKLTVNKSIEITAQPASATVAEGASATFKVEAKGTGLTYQWQFKSAGSNFWSDSSMAGSKTNSITVKGTTARNGYQYRCVVKDANGSKVTTNAAKLTVQ